MHIIRFFTVAIFSGFLVMLSPPADAGDKLTESNMTRADFERLTEVAPEIAPDGGSVSVAPEATHDPGRDGRKEMKDNGAVKVIDGDQWRDMSPEQRRDRILELRRGGLDPNVMLVLLVPRGDVYAVPSDKVDILNESRVLRPWRQSEIDALPNRGGIRGRFGSGRERRGQIHLQL